LYDQAPTVYNYSAPKQRNRGRRIAIWIAAVLVVLVALDFAAKAYAESRAATEIQQRGFPTKPNVSIAGFPFLTQVITRHFEQITISSSNLPAGPLTISSLRMTMDNVRLNSFNFSGGTAGPLNGTIVISLGALGGALAGSGPLGQFLGGGGLVIKSVGNNLIKGSLNLAGGLVNASATWQVSATGSNEIRLHLVSSSGLPGPLSSAAQNITLPVSALPAGLRLTGGLSSSSDGIVANVSAQSISFGS
jgi:LmeA-like phospholipid-binding